MLIEEHNSYGFENEYPIDENLIMQGLPDFSDSLVDPDINFDGVQPLVFKSHTTCEESPKDLDLFGCLNIPKASSFNNIPLTFAKLEIGNEDKDLKKETPISHISQECEEKDEEMPSNSDSSNKSSQKTRKPVLRRWAKKNDKVLFNQIKIFQEKGFLTKEYLMNLKTKRSTRYSQKIKILAEASDWRGFLDDMVERIQSLYSNQSFSVRETKLLKKLVRPMIEQGEINYELLESEFPAKEVTVMKSIVKHEFSTTISLLYKEGKIFECSNLIEFVTKM